MQPYSFEILEADYMLGAPARVGRVIATDLDEGENARITYYLSAEDGDNPYSIQQVRVWICQKQYLDTAFHEVT